jgi:Cd2+/Zn2+-exporting ATPase
MIGRFSKPGAYLELLQSRELPRALVAGGPALASYVWDGATGTSTMPGMALALVSVAINGFPIIWAEEICAKIGVGVRGRVAGGWVEVGSASIAGGAVDTPIGICGSIESIKKIGATPLVVYRNERPLAIIGVADRVRPTAKETVGRLRAMGIEHVGILSGDHERSACLVAESVGSTGVWSEMKPEDKPRVIRQFQSGGRSVVFIGDGINDAPALATANVGIAMGAAGTDVALETADVALMNDDISKVPFLIHLGRRMLKVIKCNIVFGLAFNLAAVAASGGGFLTPIVGALVHNIGSVLVVLSSASMVFTAEQPLPAASLDK